MNLKIENAPLKRSSPLPTLRKGAALKETGKSLQEYQE
jgi:hypothetical protein